VVQAFACVYLRLLPPQLRLSCLYPPHFANMHFCVRTRKHTHTRTCTHVYTHKCTYTHAYTHAHTHVYTHAHTCTHLHTHVYIRRPHPWIPIHPALPLPPGPRARAGEWHVSLYGPQPVWQEHRVPGALVIAKSQGAFRICICLGLA